MNGKEKAFTLFGEGKSLSDSEVKAFKLRNQTRYNYYLEWQEGGGITPSSLSSGEAKGSGGAQSPILTFLGSLSFTLASLFMK